MVLKTDLEKELEKVKTERDFAIERLEKSYETNFKLRQENTELKKRMHVIDREISKS